MPYNFSLLEEKVEGVKNWLAGEFSVLRTGRASPAILDGVKVLSYGSSVSLSHIAGVSTEDVKTLRVTPWDKGQIKEVEKALIAANLGVSIVADSDGLRVIFPELTAERREALKKILKNKLEEARVSLRGARDDTWSDIQKQEKEGAVSEDDKFRFKEKMEKIIEKISGELVEMEERKEKEISS